jgi:ribosomal protein L10
MQKRTLPRLALNGAGWAHPYGHGPFAPYLYADGGDGGDSGSGNDDSGDDSSDGDQDDDAGGTGDDDQGDDAAKGEKPKPKPPAKKANEDPAAELERLRKELKQANADAAKARTTAKKNAAEEAKAELVQQMGKALGLVKDDKDEAPDPAKLTAEIERAQKAHRETAIELAVFRGAGKHGADAAALTDSRSFLKSIADLDPNDEGFDKAVNAAIKAAVADNPKLRAQSQAPARTSGDFSGSSEKPTAKNSIEAQREARRKARNG